jgi:pyrroloquinoline-quinone synthase
MRAARNLLTRQALLENLIDEEHGRENHWELWLRFAEALGVARKTVFAAEPLRAARALVDIFTRLDAGPTTTGRTRRPLRQRVAGSAVAAAKIDGLRRFYGISSGDRLRFLRVHRKADPHHARSVARMVEHHSRRPEDRQLTLEAGRIALKAVWSMLDAV